MSAEIDFHDPRWLLGPAQREAPHRTLSATVAEPAGSAAQAINQVEGNRGVVIQAERIIGDVHVHPKPREEDG